MSSSWRCMVSARSSVLLSWSSVRPTGAIWSGFLMLELKLACWVTCLSSVLLLTRSSRSLIFMYISRCTSLSLVWAPRAHGRFMSLFIVCHATCIR